MDLGTLLNFIKPQAFNPAPSLPQMSMNMGQQMPQAQAQSLGDLMSMVKQTPDPTELERYKQIILSKHRADAADKYGDIISSVSQSTNPYQMGENELFPGEASIPGLREKMDLKDRIALMNQKMIESGNPILQKQGLENLAKIQAEDIKSQAMMDREQYKIDNQRSTAHRMAIEQNLVPGTKEYIDFINKYALKQNYESSFSKPFTVSEAGNLMYSDGTPVNPGDSYESAMRAGKKVVLRNNLSGDAAARASYISNADKSFSQVKSLLYGAPDEGGNYTGPINRRVITDAYVTRYDPTGGLLSNLITTPEGQKFAQALETVVQNMLRFETGATLGNNEMDNIRLRIQPIPTASDEVINQQMGAIDYFLKNAKAFIDPIKRQKIKELKTRGEAVPPELLQDLVLEGWEKARAAYSTKLKKDDEPPLPNGYSEEPTQ